MGGLRSHLTYANVMSTIAVLLVVTGGVAYAAATIGSDDVINDSLHSVDLKNGVAVRSADVVNDTVTGGGLTRADLAAGAVRSSEVANDSLTGADVDEDTLAGGYTQGVYSATPIDPPGTLLAIPGLGTLTAQCQTTTMPVYLQFDAAASGPVDWFSDLDWSTGLGHSKDGTIASDGQIFIGTGEASSLGSGDSVHLQLNSGPESASIEAVVSTGTTEGCTVTAGLLQ